MKNITAAQRIPLIPTGVSSPGWGVDEGFVAIEYTKREEVPPPEEDDNDEVMCDDFVLLETTTEESKESTLNDFVFIEKSGPCTRPRISIPPSAKSDRDVIIIGNEYQQACLDLGNTHKFTHDKVRKLTELQVLTELKTYAFLCLIITLKTKFTRDNWYGASWRYEENIITAKLIAIIQMVDKTLSKTQKTKTLCTKTIPKEKCGLYARCFFEIARTTTLYTQFKRCRPAENLIFLSLSKAYLWDDNSFEDLPICECILSTLSSFLYARVIAFLYENHQFMTYDIRKKQRELDIMHASKLFTFLNNINQSSLSKAPMNGVKIALIEHLIEQFLREVYRVHRFL